MDQLTRQLVDADLAVPAQARSLAIASGGRPGVARRLAADPEAVLARGRISRTLLESAVADRRRRLAAAPDLMADAAALDAAIRGEVAPSGGRLQPVDRRRAVLLIIEIWRDLGRDLAVAVHGGSRELRDLDQLEELRILARGLDADDLHRFLDRLDRLSVAIEGYASPELTLDTLLLTWPRPSSDTASAA